MSKQAAYDFLKEHRELWHLPSAEIFHAMRNAGVISAKTYVHDVKVENIITRIRRDSGEIRRRPKVHWHWCPTCYSQIPCSAAPCPHAKRAECGPCMRGEHFVVHEGTPAMQAAPGRRIVR